ncbi:MAG: mycofactocin system glycosyltransferase [Actinomycetota bacterium]|jgi:mycofactocin system glycosyltransferase
MRELRRDRHWWRSKDGNGLVAGTPGSFFRLTEKGSQIVDSIDAGRPVDGSPLVDRLIAAGAVHPLPGAGVPHDRVTVVIPVFARTDDDVTRVQSLVDALSPLRVVVVDDASPVTVGVRAWRVIRLDTNSGPGAARNAGVREVTTDYVALVDDDVEVTPAQILRLTGHFSDPNVSCVAPRVATHAGSTFVSQYEALRSPLDMGPDPARVRPRSLVPFVPTAVLVARTAAMRGAFDESLRFGEDVDFEWRSVDDAAQCRYEPDVVCHHAARPSVASMLKQRYRYGRSAADIDRRHPWSVAPVRSHVLHVLPLALLLSGQLFLAFDALFLSAAYTHFALRKMGLSGRQKIAVSRLGIAVASRHLSTAVTREWWPLFVAFSWLMPVSVAFYMTFAGVLLLDFRRKRPDNIAAYAVLRVLDNLAYGAGVWAGAFRTRSLRCLLPRLSLVQRRGG